MLLDDEYLDRLVKFFKENENQTFVVNDISANVIKFEVHVKHYIDNRHNIDGYVDVSFNNDYSKIMVYEKF